METASFTTVVDAVWNMYQVSDPGGLPTEPPEAVPSPWGDNGLTGLQSPSHATISCGMHYGPVRVTVEEHDSAPVPDLPGWTDIVELPFQVVSGEVVLTDWNGEPFHDITNLVPGEYRLRVHARGRDEGRARTYELSMDDDPVEEHMIQLFPGRGDQVVYKAEDENGAMLRGATVAAPLPRGRERLPQAEFEAFERSRDIILGLTADMSIPARQLIIELVSEQLAAQMPVYEPQPRPEPDHRPPPAPVFDMDAILAQAIAAMPPELRAMVDDSTDIQNRHVRVEPPVRQVPDDPPDMARPK